MNRPFPPEKWICPFVLLGEVAVENPEYRDAPIEVGFIYSKSHEE